MANPSGAGGWQAGESGNPGGRPLKHGRYSLVQRGAQADKFHRFLNESGKPGDLTDELALLRSLLQEVLDDKSLLSSEMKPELETLTIIKLVDAIGRKVERIARIANQSKLTSAHIRYLQTQLVELIGRHVHEPETRERFLAELEAAFEPRRIGQG